VLKHEQLNTVHYCWWCVLCS